MEWQVLSINLSWYCYPLVLALFQDRVEPVNGWLAAILPGLRSWVAEDRLKHLPSPRPSILFIYYQSTILFMNDNRHSVQTIGTNNFISSNYSDLTRPHPKWWFSKGHALISEKSRLVKYYNLARFYIFLPFAPVFIIQKGTIFFRSFSISKANGKNPSVGRATVRSFIGLALVKMAIALWNHWRSLTPQGFLRCDLVFWVIWRNLKKSSRSSKVLELEVLVNLKISWLFDIGDYNTQLYGDYNKPI